MKGIGGRIGVVCALLVLVFTGFAWRLIHLQVLQHDYFVAIAAEKHERREPIPARRGRILDRNGEELAVNIPVRTVTADGTHIQDPAALASVAAPFLDIPVDELTEKLSSKRPYMVIRKEVSEEKAQDMMRAIDKANLHGLYIKESSLRSYPNGDMHIAVGVTAKGTLFDIKAVEICLIDGPHHVLGLLLADLLADHHVGSL